MLIATNTQGFDLTDALRDHVERRLGFAFARGGERIRRILVRLSDINGPRGGCDKRCHLRVCLEQSPEVVIEETQGDLYSAVDRAAKRAAVSIARRLSRQRARRRDGASPGKSEIADRSANQLEEARR